MPPPALTTMAAMGRRRQIFAWLVGVHWVSFAVCASAAPGEECAEAPRAARELRTAGRLSAARSRLAGCMSDACAARTREQCAAQLAEIDAAMPALMLEIKDSNGHDLRGVGVTVDSKRLTARVDGNPISVDPGEHRLSFAATGFRRVETTVVAREGDRRRRVLVFLDRENPSGAAVTTEAALDATAPPPPENGEAPAAFSSARSRKKIALGLAGAGAGVLVLGAVWGVLAKSEYDHALDSECGGDRNSCSPQGIADGHTAHQRATVATVVVAGGAVLLAAAAAVYFIAPKQDQVTVAPAIDGKGAGLTMFARW